MSPSPPRARAAAAERQLAALASPMRARIASFFESHGELSVREVAELVERPAQSIHFHVRRLEEAGVLVHRNSRPTVRRPESVYGLATRRIRVDRRLPSKLRDRAEVRAAATFLRQAQREYARAVESGEAARLSRDHCLRLHREQARLTRAELREVQRRLDSLTGYIQQCGAKRPSRGGRTCALTLVLTPAEAARSRKPSAGSPGGTRTSHKKGRKR